MELPRGHCHVWWGRPVSWQRRLWEVLGPEERARHDRLRRPDDRGRYLAAHALARVVLGGYLDTSPAGLRFVARCAVCGGPHGKPRLAGVDSDIEFSLAHSGSRVCVAVARVAVGVDVEALSSELDLRTMPAEVLSPAERGGWSLLAGADRAAGLLRYWTRKEALLKATGAGLSVPLQALTVTAPHERAGLVRWDRGPDETPIHLRDLHPGPGFVACLAAVSDDSPRVEERDGDRALRDAAPP